MSLHSERYFELVERMGGVNPEALESMVYWNNPLALKHWTMNVVELLFIAGAVLALKHALDQRRLQHNSAYLGIWLSAVIYCFVLEVPVYFPQLLGLPANVIFIHNEFTLGFVFNQTPLYIMCLYPALLYGAYVFVERLGVFERAPLLVGAICVGFVHSCIYEIFDHYGPLYNWWIWDYEHPANTLLLGSVPWLSIANFSLIPPIAFTVLARLFLFRKTSAATFSPALVLKCLAIAVLTPILMVLIAPTGIVALVTDDPKVLLITCYLTLAVAGVVTVTTFIRSRAESENASSGSLWSYPFNVVVLYLVVFLGLWLAGLPDHLSAVDGVTPFGTYSGSLSYTIGCFLFCFFFLFQLRRSVSTHTIQRLEGEVHV